MSDDLDKQRLYRKLALGSSFAAFVFSCVAVKSCDFLSVGSGSRGFGLFRFEADSEGRCLTYSKADVDIMSPAAKAGRTFGVLAPLIGGLAFTAVFFVMMVMKKTKSTSYSWVACRFMFAAAAAFQVGAFSIAGDPTCSNATYGLCTPTTGGIIGIIAFIFWIPASIFCIISTPPELPIFIVRLSTDADLETEAGRNEHMKIREVSFGEQRPPSILRTPTQDTSNYSSPLYSDAASPRFPGDVEARNQQNENDIARFESASLAGSAVGSAAASITGSLSTPQRKAKKKVSRKVNPDGSVTVTESVVFLNEGAVVVEDNDEEEAKRDAHL